MVIIAKFNFLSKLYERLIVLLLQKKGDYTIIITDIYIHGGIKYAKSNY